MLYHSPSIDFESFQKFLVPFRRGFATFRRFENWFFKRVNHFETVARLHFIESVGVHANRSIVELVDCVLMTFELVMSLRNESEGDLQLFPPFHCGIV